jgi:hypothetical protein
MAKPQLDWESIRQSPFVTWLAEHGLLRPHTYWTLGGLYPDTQPVYVRRDTHTGNRDLIVRPKRKFLELT